MNPMMIEPANISSSSSFNINPKIVEERMGPYSIRVINEQVVKPNPRDTLRFDVTVTLRQFSIYDWRLRLIRTSTLLETSTSISFQSLFEDNQDFFTISVIQPRMFSLLHPKALIKYHGILFPLFNEPWRFRAPLLRLSLQISNAKCSL